MNDSFSGFTDYQVLLDYNKGQHIPYGTLLLTKEWRRRRSKVIDNDKMTCQKCGVYANYQCFESYYLEMTDAEWKIMHLEKKRLQLENIVALNLSGRSLELRMLFWRIIKFARPIGERIKLEVHHKLYYQDCLPWEYLDEELTTLCKSCHTKTHEEEKIPVYRSRGSKEFLYNSYDCSRCGGSGILPEFKHVEKGICFSCNGRGRHEIIK
ncbi:hypothetical protein [Flavobacterium sp. HSC-61S13]|uniref:hypothetical protein n=1 Tax=Flavobacterium sp. HSC-61S13 TaxID=2910963 RepID=UPI0020A21801|nr:hypothetical protein [Flavobacterium sp. HSC-61S13]MCP1996679.1 hypothetical protein [Flavobacterium sp. HSC-61S13]